MSLPRALAVPAVLTFLAACQPAAPAALTDADQAALRASVDTFSARVLRYDWPGTAGLFTDQGTMMPANEPAVVGRDAIQAWMKAYPPITAFTSVVDELSGVGDLAYIRGHYVVTVMPPGAKAAVTDSGKFITVNRRQADGQWLIVADIFNSNKAAM